VLAEYDTSSLKCAFTAGSQLPAALSKQVSEQIGDVIYNLYGSTEVSVATVATPADWRRAPGTVGRPPVGCKVRLYDADDQVVRKPYQRGRIFVGSGLTVGDYTGDESDPDSTGDGAKPGIDGLVSTGDVGHFDSNGLLFIDGRADDMIISGGENVYPGEVENLLVEHPYINDAAVVGVPDRDFGQRLKAYVVMERGAWLAPEEVKLFVRTHLARFKVPREVMYVTDLPRNATGKLLRHLLR
jgi:fatty-acyl-CoA synthase